MPPPDCQQTDPAQQQLREQLEDALRLAERFTRRYDELLRAFQAEMLNTSSLLDQLNRQFGWVSRLANLTQGTDGFLQVTTVRPPWPEGSERPRPIVISAGPAATESGSGGERGNCEPGWAQKPAAGLLPGRGASAGN